MADIASKPAARVPWTSADVRRAFIEFFQSKPSPADGHVFVPSSPSAPHDDPTLLFTNAGMNQFKKIFLGQADPRGELARLKRAVNSQKCIRAGGKHNDLEDVGKDSYHHTFFEMLGNWSFGDYFKKEAVAWSWELLTEVYGIPADRLYATYFGGDAATGLGPDLETRDLWLRHLPASHVLAGNMKDNFWEMGDTGPCGPCSEIHYDRVGGRGASSLVNAGNAEVIEIWNNVFIQFNREEDGKLRPLPARHVDTGMGFERLVSVLQNVPSNYDTDIFAPLFRAVEVITGARPYRGRFGRADAGGIDTAYRVVADHIRTLTIAITDGALPSNTGRGYVLRRILRRAARFGRQMLGAKPGLLARLVPVVVESLGDAFPELTRNPARVADIIREEEESFGRTLDRGIKLFDQVAESASGGVISGADAFKLYDTYGFPIDLTELMAAERGLRVDMAAYDAERKKAEELSRAAQSKGEGSRLALDAEAIAKLRHQRVEPTDDLDKFHARDISAKVEAIFNGENFDQHARLSQGTLRPIGIVLNRTNLYAEMGGQECDHGRLTLAAESHGEGPARHGEFKVESVQNYGGFVLHVGHVAHGELRVGDRVTVHVDKQRRGPIQANHTATHLLNFALRRVLGSHVDQKGSLVAPDRFRFDFAHGQPAAPGELGRVEEVVREQIKADLQVYADAAPLGEARRINGLRAVFGEQYPDPVRTVSIGMPVSDLLANPENPAWLELSVEFCGGTHVGSTAEIGAFAVVMEEAVAKGVRRVVGLTGPAAARAIAEADAAEARIKSAAGLDDSTLPQAVGELLAGFEAAVMPVARKALLRAEIVKLQERVKNAQRKASGAKAEEAAKLAQQIAASAAAALEDVVVATLDVGDDRQALQAAVNAIRRELPKAAIMLFGVDSATGKIAIAASVPPPLVDKGLKAGDWVREAATACGGKGGGKPDAASGGGSDAAKVRDAVAVARQYAAKILM